MKSVQSVFFALLAVLTVVFSPFFATSVAWAIPPVDPCPTTSEVPGSYAETCVACEVFSLSVNFPDFLLEANCEKIDGSYEKALITWIAGDPPVSNCDGKLTLGSC